MENERKVKNNEIEIEEVNVYTDDCGTTRKDCVKFSVCFHSCVFLFSVVNSVAARMNSVICSSE